jgi:hypothetical protein
MAGRCVLAVASEIQRVGKATERGADHPSFKESACATTRLLVLGILQQLLCCALHCYQCCRITGRLPMPSWLS